MPQLYQEMQSIMRSAATLPENLLADNSINWNFVDADTFMELNPVPEQVEEFYEYFNLIADDILSESTSYVI